MINVSQIDGLLNAHQIEDVYSNAKGKLGSKVKGAISGAKAKAESEANQLKKEAAKANAEVKAKRDKVEAAAKLLAASTKSAAGKASVAAKAHAKAVHDKAIADLNKAKVHAKDVKKAHDKALEKLRGNIKKVKTNIKSKIGAKGKSLRNRLRKAMRKRIVIAISNNIHGIATRLYPAISTNTVFYKPAYIPKSKSSYASVLAEWKKIGGAESDLKEAIMTGYSKKRFAMRGKHSGVDGISDTYNNLRDIGFFNAAGDDDVAGAPDTNDDGSDSDTADVPTDEDTKNGFMGFISRILGIFKKNKSDENPLNSNSPDGADFSSEDAADTDKPSDSESNNDTMSELDNTATTSNETTTSDDDDSTDSDVNPKAVANSKSDGAGTKADITKKEPDVLSGGETGANDTIFGFNKYAVMGVGALALVGAFFGIRHFVKKGNA